MTDRELLEAAAFAAGISVIRSRLDDPACGDFLVKNSARNSSQMIGPWNPLTDDGDALRLAVQLEIQIDPRDPETRTYGPVGERVDEYHRPDPYAATRRAIVRAAAAIGGVQ